MNTLKKELILIIIIGLVSIAAFSYVIQAADRPATAFRVYVDSDYGFYRVLDMTSHNSSGYTNHTLTINVGDTVEWMNDATPDERLTILSKDELWSNTSALLRWNYQKYNYTFTTPGIFNFSIKEYPRVKAMTISVKAIEKEQVVPAVVVSQKQTLEATPAPTPAQTAREEGMTALDKILGVAIVSVAAATIVAIFILLRIPKNKTNSKEEQGTGNKEEGR